MGITLDKENNLKVDACGSSTRNKLCYIIGYFWTYLTEKASIALDSSLNTHKAFGSLFIAISINISIFDVYQVNLTVGSPMTSREILG